MKSALRIFGKDVRHLWPRIVLVVGLDVLARWAESAPVLAGVLNGAGFGGLALLGQLYLIASVVHEEALPGDRQYWLTRPYSRKGLLAAKLLFFLAFIHLPALAADAGALWMRGLSPLAHWPTLALAQLFILEAVLFGAAAASVSAGLMQFVWTLLAACLGFLSIWLALNYQIGGNVDWGGVEWIHATARAVFAISAAVAILAIQYAARKTVLSRLTLAAGVLAVIFTFWMPGWHAAFALQSRIGGRRLPDSVVRIDQDAPRGREVAPLREGYWRPQFAAEVPILVSGIPPGMALQSDRVAATGVMLDGRVWHSGWDDPWNRLAQVIGGAKTTREQRMLPGQDTWLYVNLDTPPIGAWRATAALTLLSAEKTTPLAAGQRPTRVPGGGLCWVAGLQDLSVACSWPAPTPGYAAIRIRTKETPAAIETPLLQPISGVSYGPYASSGDIWQTTSTNIGVSAGTPDIVLVTRNVVAHIERSVDIRGAGGR